MSNLAFLSLVLAQDDDTVEGDPTAEELCENRPADEYFRLSTSGDCRDVVRSVQITRDRRSNTVKKSPRV